ncbi:hypothetical protein LOD99_6627 [Oopsacas minuta]|uniref:Uncharacterized protein n=1 Tax=Oopsacas minuta TaxID=111878 RepID=A0AAV7JLD7_9METZ|nr:hypothetical protein LOD99_6627 [Oopsacas minuta]
MTEQKYTSIQQPNSIFPLRSRVKFTEEEDELRLPYGTEFFDQFPYDTPPQWWPLLYVKKDSKIKEGDAKYYCRTSSEKTGQKYFVRKHFEIPLHMMLPGIQYPQFNHFAIIRDQYEDEKWFNRRTPMGHLAYYFRMRKKYRNITSRVVQRPFFDDKNIVKQEVSPEFCGLEVILKMLGLEFYAPMLCDHQLFDTYHFNFIGRNEITYFHWKPLEFRRLLRHLRDCMNRESTNHSHNEYAFAYFKQDQYDPNYKFQPPTEREMYLVATEYEVGLLPFIWRKIGLTMDEKRAADELAQRERLPTTAAYWKFWQMKDKPVTVHHIASSVVSRLFTVGCTDVVNLFGFDVVDGDVALLDVVDDDVTLLDVVNDDIIVFDDVVNDDVIISDDIVSDDVIMFGDVVSDELDGILDDVIIFVDVVVSGRVLD